MRTRRYRWYLLLLGGAASLAASGSLVCAQALRPVLVGVVLDRNRAPIGGAEVVLLEDDVVSRGVTADDGGRFRLGDLPTGPISVRVRRLGYHPRTLNLEMLRDRPTEITVSLDVLPQELEKVVALGAAAESRGRLLEFFERKARNSFGHYIERSSFERRQPQYISEVLRTTPGVTVRPSARIGNLVRIRGCAPLVWVDGVRMPGAELDEAVQVNEVAAIEIYNSFAGIPAQYFDRAATCGTVLIWTRS